MGTEERKAAHKLAEAPSPAPEFTLDDLARAVRYAARPRRVAFLGTIRRYVHR